MVVSQYSLFALGIVALMGLGACSGGASSPAPNPPGSTPTAAGMPTATPPAATPTPTPPPGSTPTPVPTATATLPGSTPTPTPPPGSTPTPTPTKTPTPSPTNTPASTPTPTPTPTKVGATLPLSYNAATACVNHVVFTNNVLPSNVGEFATNGLNRSFWGGVRGRTEAPIATWGPGFYPSWGRHQYDTFMGDSTDGTGLPDPFSIVSDSAAPGSPKALRISAIPIPSPMATSLVIMQNDQYIVTSSKTSYKVPSEGGSLSVDVNDPNSAQRGWKVGIGYQGGAITFIGTLTSGGATPSGTGTGGSNPWTISNIHIYAGAPGTTIVPGSNDEGGFRSYNFPSYYAGTLDANVNQEYGFFVARMRLPKGLPGLSPAFWMLETGGVGTNNGQLLRSEWDVEEHFANDYGYNLNAGNILWNSDNTGPWYSYGCGISCGSKSGTTAPGSTGVYPWPSSGNYNSDYHDYGVLVEPGGPPRPTNYAGGGGNYVENNSPWTGTTFFLDGNPIAGHIGQPDLTQGSPDKEIMAMFQIANPGTFLDPDGKATSNPWPQFMYVQWIRAYKPSSSSC